MSIPAEQSSSSTSSSHSHHHHHSHSHGSHKHKHRMDDSDRFKKHGLSSIKRRKLMGQILFWALVLAAIAVMIAVMYVYKFTPARAYK